MPLRRPSCGRGDVHIAGRSGILTSRRHHEELGAAIGLGDEDRQDYFHTTIGHPSMHQLGETPDAFKGGEVRLAMTWDADALQSLMTIPPMVRKMVTDQTEEYCRSKGDDKVSQARFTQYAADQGMTPELMERFQKKKKTA